MPKSIRLAAETAGPLASLIASGLGGTGLLTTAEERAEGRHGDLADDEIKGAHGIFAFTFAE